MDQHPEDIDDAIDKATRRVGEAEHEFTSEPPESPELVPKARRVERRAEDLHALAADAADDLDDEEGRQPVP